MAKNPKKNIYHIILTSNGKRIKTIYNCQSEQLANKKFKELIEENKSVKFPVKYINIGKLVEANYELYIVKYDNDAPKQTKLRDENGKVINFETDNDGWVVYDRENYYKEESFWVYGFHPVYQRKDYDWIYDDIVRGVDKYNLKQIFTFQNKLLISSTYDLRMILCKNISDCIRLYNNLERDVENKKIKYVCFSGDAYHSSLKKKWYDKLMKLTGWDHHKLSRNSLRP